VHEQRNYELHSGLHSKHAESQFQYDAKQILAASSDKKRNLFKSFNKIVKKTQTFRSKSTLWLDLGFLHNPLIKFQMPMEKVPFSKTDKSTNQESFIFSTLRELLTANMFLKNR